MTWQLRVAWISVPSRQFCNKRLSPIKLWTHMDSLPDRKHPLRHDAMNPYRAILLKSESSAKTLLKQSISRVIPMLMVISVFALISSAVLYFGAWPLADLMTGGYVVDSTVTPLHSYWWGVARRLRSFCLPLSSLGIVLIGLVFVLKILQRRGHRQRIP